MKKQQHKTKQKQKENDNIFEADEARETNETNEASGQRKHRLTPIFKDAEQITRRLNFTAPLEIHKLLKARAKQLGVNYSDYFIALAMNDLGIELDADSIPNVWLFDKKEVEEKIDNLTAQRYKKALENLLTLLGTAPEDFNKIFKD